MGCLTQRILALVVNGWLAVMVRSWSPGNASAACRALRRTLGSAPGTLLSCCASFK